MIFVYLFEVCSTYSEIQLYIVRNANVSILNYNSAQSEIQIGLLRTSERNSQSTYEMELSSLLSLKKLSFSKIEKTKQNNNSNSICFLFELDNYFNYFLITFMHHFILQNIKSQSILDHTQNQNCNTHFVAFHIEQLTPYFDWVPKNTQSII